MTAFQILIETICFLARTTLEYFQLCLYDVIFQVITYIICGLKSKKKYFTLY